MGTDKAMLDWYGRPLVLHVAKMLAAAAEPVVLASGAPGRLGGMGYATVADGVAGAGPLAGIVAALGWSPHPLVAAVAVDLPSLDVELLAGLASACDGHAAAVPVTPDGNEQVLHAIYSAEAFEPLAASLEAGERSLRRALTTLDVAWIPVADEAFARNLNTPDDLFG